MNTCLFCVVFCRCFSMTRFGSGRCCAFRRVFCLAHGKEGCFRKEAEKQQPIVGKASLSLPPCFPGAARHGIASSKRGQARKSVKNFFSMPCEKKSLALAGQALDAWGGGAAREAGRGSAAFPPLLPWWASAGGLAFCWMASEKNREKLAS